MVDWYSLAVWFYLICVIASTAWLVGQYDKEDDE